MRKFIAIAALLSIPAVIFGEYKINPYTGVQDYYQNSVSTASYSNMASSSTYSVTSGTSVYAANADTVDGKNAADFVASQNLTDHAVANASSFSGVAVSTTTLGTRIDTVQASTVTIGSLGNQAASGTHNHSGVYAVIADTVTVGVNVASYVDYLNLRQSTVTIGALATQAAAGNHTHADYADYSDVATDTTTLKGAIDTVQSSVYAVGADTGTLATRVSSTQSDIVSIGISTGSHASANVTSFSNVAVSTTALSTRINTVNSDLVTLEQSTGTLVRKEGDTMTGTLVVPSIDTGGKHWELIYSTITDVANSTITISGINSEVDLEYKLDFVIKSASSSATSYVFAINSNYNPNYGWQYMSASGASLTAASLSATSTALFAYSTGVGQYCAGSITIFAQSGRPRQYTGTVLNSSISSTATTVTNVCGVWNNTAGVITALRISSREIEGGISANSVIRLWALR